MQTFMGVLALIVVIASLTIVGVVVYGLLWQVLYG